MTRRSRSSLLALIGLLITALMVSTGCNPEPDFDVDELFSLKDYARDTDYALGIINMMNQFHVERQEAVSYLGGNLNAANFEETPPVGWIPSEVQGFEQYYERRFPDGSVDLIGFDVGITPPEDISPVKVDYMSIKNVQFVGGVNVGLGDSLVFWYADDYNNLARVEGEASYVDLDVVFFGSGAAFGAAGMLNQWTVQITDALSDPDALQGRYDLSGITTIVEAQTEDTVDLIVDGSIVIRPDGSGEASLYVDDEERLRMFFTRYDTEYHGYFQQSDDEFQEKLYF
ncbi:hypothetical protein GF324_06930 [bacterium]|nr:hypothetical protein [bacterium]